MRQLYLSIILIVLSCSLLQAAPVPSLPLVDKAIVDLQLTAKDFEKQEDLRAVFAKVYWRVTSEFRHWIVNEKFNDGEAVAQMVVEFHHLYKKALAEYDYQGPQSNAAWMISFDQRDNFTVKPTVHLLLGLNAHIATDLPITLAKVMETVKDKEKLKKDFFLMNDLFKKLIPELFSILRSLNQLLDMDGLNFFPLQRTKELIVWMSIKNMRQEAFNDGMQLLQTQGPYQREVLLKKQMQKAVEQANFYLSVESFIPYKSLP
jgi:hypothetical protein